MPKASSRNGTSSVHNVSQLRGDEQNLPQDNILWIVRQLFDTSQLIHLHIDKGIFTDTSFNQLHFIGNAIRELPA